MESYVAATRLCNVDAPAIQQKAAELQAGTDEETSQNIFRFVRDHIQYNIRRKLQGAETVLETGDGSCFDKTNLLIALHRAAGIPARYVQLTCDLEVRDDSLPAEAFHLVAEVNIDGEWQILDPSFDDSVSAIVTPSTWGEQTWTTVHSEKRYAELPVYLPPILNHVIVPFSRKIKKIQQRLDELPREE